jgi:hypothetical protein
MANDITLANSGEAIKHGTLVIAPSPFTNSFQYQNVNVYNKPVITDIENKYDERFDDITYYTIGSGTFIGA